MIFRNAHFSLMRWANLNSSFVKGVTERHLVSEGMAAGCLTVLLRFDLLTECLTVRSEDVPELFRLLLLAYRDYRDAESGPRIVAWIIRDLFNVQANAVGIEQAT